MNYHIVTASHRVNSYLRSGELQDIGSTLYSVACVSIGYTIAVAYVLTLWAIDTLLTPHFDDSWSPQEWEISPVHTVCSQPIVDAVPYVQSEEAKARQIKYSMPIKESFRLTTTPRNQKFKHDQIVAIGLELCSMGL